MDFFENAVSKAKDVFDVACKKTEEVITTGKQKLDIATLENKMCKDFEALGKIYYEVIKERDDLDFKTADLKAAILQKEGEIAKIKEEMER